MTESIADLPTALAELLTATSAPPPAPAKNNGHRPHERYAVAALEQEIGKLLRTQNGNRNDQLNRSAFNLGQLVGAAALDRGTVEAELAAAARELGLPEKEAEKTIKSGLSSGEQQPRSLPEPRQHRKRQPASSAGVIAESDTTDTANGLRLARRHGASLRYVGAWGWLAWDGRRWARDDSQAIYRLAKETARSIYVEAYQAATDAEVKQLAGWAKTSLSWPKIEAMLKMAESEEPITARPDEFDRDPMSLNCENGIIDLRTGDLRPADPAAHLTRLAPVAFDPDAKCDLWAAFLEHIFDHDAVVIRFFQKAVGYSLTGDTSEQCWFLLHGTGANGKSTALQTLLALFGDYGTQADPSAFMAKRNDGPTNDIARLFGARFVSAVEIGEGRNLAEVLVKQLTGGDTISARFLHKEFFEFKPSLKLWLAGNHKPNITGTDYAIWRRVRFIPFTVTIPEPERDKHLADKLRAELPGILAWAVAGCLAWQREGLQAPPQVTAATDAYRVEQDTLASFLAECCVVKAGTSARASDLHETYKKWGGGDSPREFGLRLKERGFEPDRGAQGARVWRGIGLLATEEDR